MAAGVKIDLLEEEEEEENKFLCQDTLYLEN